ncbi:MAG TPA: EVE domain-containing protein [Phycisphaerales bacterium]|nr:EVE domain-containing protein [Phycisphaerales bacterium]
MATFLVKTEPDDYSFADLLREKRCVWTGVKNPAALIALRSMRKGDRVLVYHTGGEKAIVGEAKVVSPGAYEDPGNPGVNDRGEPKFAVVDLVPVKAFPHPVPLAVIKTDPRFKSFALVKQSRLSVMPVTAPEEAAIRELASKA